MVLKILDFKNRHSRLMIIRRLPSFDERTRRRLYTKNVESVDRQPVCANCPALIICQKIQTTPRRA